MNDDKIHTLRHAFLREEHAHPLRHQDGHAKRGEMRLQADRNTFPSSLISAKGKGRSHSVHKPFLAGLALTLFATAAIAAVDPNIRSVQPEHIADYWVYTNTSLNVEVPNSGVNLGKPTCSAVTYMIGSDGVTRDIVVRKTIPAGDLDSVAKSAVKDLHYVPGAKNAEREPVFTYIIMPFNLPASPAARKKITDACTLKDFPKSYR